MWSSLFRFRFPRFVGAAGAVVGAAGAGLLPARVFTSFTHVMFVSPPQLPSVAECPPFMHHGPRDSARASMMARSLTNRNRTVIHPVRFSARRREQDRR